MWVDILIKLVFALLALLFGTMAVVVIIVVLREALAGRGKHVHSEGQGKTNHRVL